MQKKYIKTGQERWAILQILDCFQNPKKSLLKSNHPKSTCQISNPPKILELKIFNPSPPPKKNHLIIPVTLNLENPPGGKGWGMAKDWGRRWGFSNKNSNHIQWPSICLTDLFSLYVLFPNVRHVIIYCTLENRSIQFSCYSCVYVAVGMKRQRGKFPSNLHWENKTYKLKRSLAKSTQSKWIGSQHFGHFR